MIPSRAPLTESQLDRLEEFLDRHAAPADGMSLEMLDGFLHAVVGGPETILPSEWMPEIWRPPGSGHDAQEWALGFLRGVELRAERWQALRDDAAFDEGWSATGLLAYGPADPLLKPRIRTQAQRDPLIKKMLAFVDQAAVYWMERYTPHEPIRRSAPKIGRNDPCPCGSGKKFKQCCGSAAKLH